MVDKYVEEREEEGERERETERQFMCVCKRAGRVGTWMCVSERV